MMASFSSAIPSMYDSKVTPDMMLFSLANLNMPEIDVELFEDQGHIDILDVSKNQLKTLPKVHLPNLKVLNCEDNAISDVQFLQQFTTLEHLYLTGNPLSAGDRYIVVDQLHNLQSLDGRTLTEVRATLKSVQEKLSTQVAFLRKEKYDKILLNDGLTEGEVAQQQKQLSRELYNLLSSAFSDIPMKFRRFKAQATAKEVFKDAVVNTQEGCASSTSEKSHEENPVVVLKRLRVPPKLKSSGNSRTDVTSYIKYKDLVKSAVPTGGALIAKKSFRQPAHNKRDLPTSELLGTENDRRTSAVHNGHFSPKQSKVRKLSHSSSSSGGRRKSAEIELDYDPHQFLRCHGPDQNKQEDSVSVWRAAFEPDKEDPARTTDVVATCGGNIVCFINCVTGHVLERYKDDNPAEVLYALAWTVSSIAGSDDRACSLLATGGAEKKIHLIYPAMLKCYHSFKAHAGEINTLIFHYSQSNWLFSGANDLCIHVWDIGLLSLPDFTTSIQKLMTFKTNSNVLHLLISSTHDCLFAACTENVMIWDFPDSDDISDTLRDPYIVDVKELCHAESGGIIDGLVAVADDCIAVKVSLEPTVYLLNISSLLKSKNEERQISPEAVLIWSSCDTSYNYLGSCKDINLMACGDNVGQIWMYDLRKFFSKVPELSSNSEDVSSPTVVLPWPDIYFEHEPLAVKEQVIINSVAFNWNGVYMVACTDTNIVCIWKKV